MAEFCLQNSAIFNCIRYWGRHNVCSAFGEGHNTFYEVIIVKKTIYTKAASAALCLAASASMAACSLTFKQPVYTASTTATVPTTESQATDGSEEVTVKPSEDDPVSSDNAYAGFIDGFKQAVNNPQDAWYYGPDIDPAKAPSDAVGITVTGIWGDSFSYILFDMDKDGTDELFIGEEVSDQNEPRINILGVVTVSDGKYKIVAAGWERSELTYLGGTSFYETGSSGASFHAASLYNYNGSKKALDLICTIEYETKEDNTSTIEFFEGENGKIKSNVAACKGKEAEEKFDNAKKEASKEKNELIGREWIKVSFK